MRAPFIGARRTEFVDLLATAYAEVQIHEPRPPSPEVLEHA
jgi:hypothetical protein